MSFYNDPSMSFMTELFKKENVKVFSIPFDVNVYDAYLESLVTCELYINRYPKLFVNGLKEIAGSVYPLLNKQTYKPMKTSNSKNNYSNSQVFSSNMNSTLEKMKRNY